MYQNKFLIAALGSTGTRWMFNTLNRGGIACTHDQSIKGGGMLHGIVGSPKWFYRMEEFDHVVQQVRHPLAYMNTQVTHNKGVVPYPYGGAEVVPFNQDPLSWLDSDPALRGKLHILMVWYRAMHFLETQPKVIHRFRIEDMNLFGEEFDKMIEAIGFDPDKFVKPEKPLWEKSWTHNPQLGIPWERKAEDLEWPDLSGQNPWMQQKLNLVQEMARRYGYV